MRTIVSIRVDVEPEKRSKLARIYPEGVHGPYGFDVWLPEDDPRVAQTFTMLAALGYRQWAGKGDMDIPNEYAVTKIREYDASDLDVADYIEIFPDYVDATINDSGRDEQGRMRLHRRSLRSGLDFARGDIEAILVPQRVKEILARYDLKHMIFIPTVASKGTGLAAERATPIPWSQVRGLPWWELGTDLTLPPLAPSMNLRDQMGNPIGPPDTSMGCIPKDGLYNHAELHYRRSDLVQAGSFDVARTFESFGPPSPIQRPSIVVSHRFYRICVEHGLETKWIPVRIDE